MTSNDINLCAVPAARKSARQKWKRVLQALLDKPNLNRFQAEKDPDVRDHCLPSTISEIEKKGLHIERRIVRIAGYAGEPAFIAEYWLPEERRPEALTLLQSA